MRCELMLSSSTNGDRFDNMLGSVIGSFFVIAFDDEDNDDDDDDEDVIAVAVNAVISASSELISLKMPDEVLSDVVEPVRMPHQSVVSVAIVLFSL